MSAQETVQEVSGGDFFWSVARGLLTRAVSRRNHRGGQVLLVGRRTFEASCNSSWLRLRHGTQTIGRSQWT
jgi:hypothetical protein